MGRMDDEVAAGRVGIEVTSKDGRRVLVVAADESVWRSLVGGTWRSVPRRGDAGPAVDLFAAVSATFDELERAERMARYMGTLQPLRGVELEPEEAQELIGFIYSRVRGWEQSCDHPGAYDVPPAREDGPPLRRCDACGSVWTRGATPTPGWVRTRPAPRTSPLDPRIDP